MVCLGRPYHFKFFKGCLPQILLGPFLNTLNQMFSTNIIFNINTIFSCPGIAGKVYILEPGPQSYSK